MTSFKRFWFHLLSLSVVTLGLSSCGPVGDGTQSGNGALSGQQGENRNGAGGGAQAGADGKVTICHIPPGNPANAHTITVGAPAVKAHLAHGDTIGPCGGGGGGGGGVDAGTGGGGGGSVDGSTGGGGGGSVDGGTSGGGGSVDGSTGGGGGSVDGGGEPSCGYTGDPCTTNNDCCYSFRCLSGVCTYYPG
ncbi:MAG TPA: hypothetical protein VH877_05505 [Polyangia bacterium]|nr:hypothetical protein [Polyangia bacterium]